MTLPIVYGARTVTFYLDGRPYQASKTMPNISELIAELSKPEPDRDRLIALVTPAEAIKKAVEVAVDANPDYLPAGKVSVTLSEIRYDGVPVGGVLVDRILANLAEGFDIMPMVRFMENLYRNPAEHARNELYLWLEQADLPITEDGYFLAYKLVRRDFTSTHGGQVKNNPGLTVSMPRQQVDPVRDHTCSRGLHFCSKDYLPSFGWGGHGNGNKVVLLKINPADVVAIPSDYSNTKGRAWQYEVLHEVDYDPMTRTWASIVSAVGTDYVAPVAPAPVVPAIAPAEPLLKHPSDQAGLLFSLCNDAGFRERHKRLAYASIVLDRTVNSFDGLTVAEASVLIDALKEKIERRTTSSQRRTVEKAAQRSRINNLGIIDLRREASKAGLKGAWKGKTSAELRAYLLSLG